MTVKVASTLGLFVLFCLTATSYAQQKSNGEAIRGLQVYLNKPASKRPVIYEQKFAQLPLSQNDSQRALELLWEDELKRRRVSRKAEMESKTLRYDRFAMQFEYRVFGDKPASGRSLFISMHGGGNTSKRVNDQQWRNQQVLYRPAEGVYVAPRAPTDSWNLWHQPHIDVLFKRLIENMVAFEEVDPNRVYLMGYSAGGDGVYQLAPRTADRWAAAAMMAGHPNETSPRGLRNLPFTLHVGELDAGYKRNEFARQWEKKLGDLQKGDPQGYTHLVKIHRGKGHWMDRQDAVAVPWMSKFRRNVVPSRIVWRQDDVTQGSFYWLGVPKAEQKSRSEVIATCSGQKIEVESSEVGTVLVRLNDQMIDFNREVEITSGGKSVFRGKPTRTIETLARTLAERGDPFLSFPAEIVVKLH